MNIAIVCGCLPILSPLSRFLRDKIPLSSIRSFSIKSLGFFSTQSSQTHHRSSMWSSRSHAQDKGCLKGGWLCSNKEQSGDGDSGVELAPAEVWVKGMEKDCQSVPVVIQSHEVRADRISEVDTQGRRVEGSCGEASGNIMVWKNRHEQDVTLCV